MSERRNVVHAVEITFARSDDRPQLLALAERAFGEMPGWDPTRVVRALENDVVFVARELESLAGYLAMRHEGRRGLLIDQVLVAPGHERHGVGRRLLAYAEGYAMHVRAPALRIVVEQTNYRARDLYRRLGFDPLERELFERSLPFPR